MFKTIFFDLETTGLAHDCDIVQIGAVTSGGNTFSVFVLPTKPFSESAKETTGMDIINGCLYKNGQMVTAKDRSTAFELFIQFLAEAYSGSKCTLVGHGAIKFDAPVLLANFQKEGLLEKLVDRIELFSDTFWELKRRNHIPKRQSLNLYKLAEYYKILNPSAGFGEHDALGDAYAVKNLAAKIGRNPNWLLAGKKLDFFLKNGIVKFVDSDYNMFPRYYDDTYDSYSYYESGDDDLFY